MARLFFLAFVASAFADEAGLKSISDVLANVKLSGKSKEAGIAEGRKMIVENLLSRVYSGNQLLPAGTRVIKDEVIPLLDQILNNLNQERADSQSALDTLIPSDYATCDPAGEQAVDAAFKKTTDTWMGYVTGNFSILNQANLNADCDSLRQLINSHRVRWQNNPDNEHLITNQPLCTIPAQDSDHMDEWEDLIVNHKNDFHASDGTSMYEQYVGERDACQSSYDAYTAQDAAADAAQGQYEQAYCIWANFRLNRCTSVALCNVRQNNNFDVVTARHTAMNTQRLNDVESVTLVRCFLDAIASNNLTQVTTARLDDFCSQHRGADYTANYSVTFPTRPSDVSCDEAAVLYGHDNGAGAPTVAWNYEPLWIDMLAVDHVCVRATNYTVQSGTSWSWQSDSAIDASYASS